MPVLGGFHSSPVQGAEISVLRGKGKHLCGYGYVAMVRYLLMEEILQQLRIMVMVISCYPIIGKVSYIHRGAGFLQYDRLFWP